MIPAPPSVNKNPPALFRVIEHDENFPVASWLCPARLRAPIAAIYRFARQGDDLADEGPASATQRLAELEHFRADLRAVASAQAHSQRWPSVFDPLREVLRDFALPVVLLEQLLDAFVQDVQFTAAARRYRDDEELLDYCTRSANPVGRLLLHLYGIGDDASLRQSDCICTSLQLINFWQDLSTDLARSRWYPSVQAMQRHAVGEADLLSGQASPAATSLIAHYASQAKALMLKGSPLVDRIGGRVGWELRLVVQGGLRILEHIHDLNFETWHSRPQLGRADLPALVWRAWRMHAPS